MQKRLGIPLRFYRWFIYFGAAFLLLSVVISIAESRLSNPFTVPHDQLDPALFHDFECAAASIPVDASVLFFTGPDGSLDLKQDTFIYYQAQYNLVPRVLSHREKGSNAFQGFTWFLGQINPELIEPLIKANKLRLVKTCGQLVILVNERSEQ